MFGDKKAKAERLDRYVDMLEAEALSPAEIAQRLGVQRSTVARDLPELEDQGVLLEEDDGKVRVFRRWW